MDCEFCGYEFDDSLGRYGCPNCLAEPDKENEMGKKLQVVKIDNALWYDGFIVVSASKTIHGYRWASGFFNRFSKSNKHHTADAALAAAAKTIGLQVVEI